MTYDPTIPQAQQSPFDTAVAIQTNFDQYAIGFASNHTPLNNRNQGDHEGVIIRRQSNDPGVTEDLAVLFCKNATSQAGTQPQLFVQIPKFLPTALDPLDMPNDPMQLTYNEVNVAGPIYQSFLPGGYLFYFGMTVDITVNITLSPAPTKILMAIAIPNTMTTVGTPVPFTVSTQIISNTDFKIYSALNGTGPVIPYSFSWMAIASA